MDKSTNQIIAEWLGECWHDHDNPFTCERCGNPRHWKPNPDYTSSLDAVSVAEKKAVEVFGLWNYAAKIWMPMKDDILSEQMRMDDEFAEKYGHRAGAESAFYKHGRFLIASAEVRAAAVRKLIEESK